MKELITISQPRRLVFRWEPMELRILFLWDFRWSTIQKDVAIAAQHMVADVLQAPLDAGAMREAGRRGAALLRGDHADRDGRRFRRRRSGQRDGERHREQGPMPPGDEPHG